MENYEKTKVPEIRSKELLDFVNNLQLDDYMEFSFNGSNFLLVYTTEEDVEKDGEDAWHHTSTAIDGSDIYILDTLPLEAKKRRLFHEILECNLADQGFSKEAHKIAMDEEQKNFGNR
ncbi:MAG: hypothetical protein Q8Q17_00990 [bacterium]|nr:hypothetical protein [bacterium]